MYGARTIGAAGAILLALSGASKMSQAQDLREVTFVQPSPSAINSFPIYVAIGEGYFADEGLDVRVESVNGSGPVLQALSADQAQFGRPGPGPVLSARARGVDVVFLYNMMPESSFGIVVLDELPYQSVERPQGHHHRRRHRRRRRGLVRARHPDERRHDRGHRLRVPAGR